MQKINFIDMTEMSPVMTPDEMKKICNHLNSKFSAFLKNESFELHTGHKGNQFQVKLILSNKDQSFFYPVEAIFINENEAYKKNNFDTIVSIIEYLTIYFEEFLSEDRNVFLSIDWSVHQSNELSFYLRGFVRNLKAEKIAEELLISHGHGEQSIIPISSES